MAANLARVLEPSTNFGKPCRRFWINHMLVMTDENYLARAFPLAPVSYLYYENLSATACRGIALLKS